MSDQERLDRYSETIWTTSRNDEGTISATGARIVARAAMAVADAEQAELREALGLVGGGESDDAILEAYRRMRDHALAADAEVARLLAECVDRESERGDLRDRVQKAEGAVARVEALLDVWEENGIQPAALPVENVRAALKDPS